MKTARILVTGATGFLGASLCKRLREQGHTVTGLGRDAARGGALAASGVRFVPCDLGDAAAVEAACAGHDYVFHCAALTSPWGDYDEFYRANVVATRNVIAAARKAAVQRLIHVSSPSIYIDHRDRYGVREDEPVPVPGINHYAETKRLAEDEIDAAHAAGLPVITIRPQGIFGPGDRAIFPRMLRIASRGWFPLIGNGKNQIDVTYIDNVVDALVLCMTSPPSTLGCKYNITNGEPIRNYELLDRMFTSLGVRYRNVRIPFGFAYRVAGVLETLHRKALDNREPPLTRYTVCVLAKSRTLDIQAAREQLGYSPRVSVTEGIERFAQWWKEQPRVAS